MCGSPNPSLSDAGWTLLKIYFAYIRISWQKMTPKTSKFMNIKMWMENLFLVTEQGGGFWMQADADQDKFFTLQFFKKIFELASSKNVPDIPEM